MTTHTITIPVSEYTYDELTAADRQLIDQAKEATQNSYSPYSHFQVGAAIRLDDGTIIQGSNQENAAFGDTLCAERTALFYAQATHPTQAFDTIAIAAQTKGHFLAQPITPCGSCRQALMEVEHRYTHPIRVLLYGTQGIYEIIGISNLLPIQFTAEDLK